MKLMISIKDAEIMFFFFVLEATKLIKMYGSLASEIWYRIRIVGYR